MSSLVATSEKICCRPRRWRDIGRRSFQAVGERGDEFRFLLLQHGIIADALGRSDGRIPLRFDEQGLSWENHSWIQNLLKKWTPKNAAGMGNENFQQVWTLYLKWGDGLHLSESRWKWIPAGLSYHIPTTSQPGGPQSPTIPHPSPSRKGFSAHGSLAFLSLVWPDLMGVATKVPPLKICEASPRARPGPMGYP